MTSTTSSPADTIADPIDMSLRLWSDDIALEPLLADFGARPGVLHVRGTRTRGGGGPVAWRHYASVVRSRSRDGAEISPWIASLVEKIERHSDLKSLIKSGQVEAVFWIALLGRGLRSEPHIGPRLVEAVAEMGGAIFIEDYVHLVDGNPSKVWLTAEPGEGRGPV